MNHIPTVKISLFRVKYKKYTNTIHYNQYNQNTQDTTKNGLHNTIPLHGIANVCFIAA